MGAEVVLIEFDVALLRSQALPVKIPHILFVISFGVSLAAMVLLRGGEVTGNSIYDKWGINAELSAALLLGISSVWACIAIPGSRLYSFAGWVALSGTALGIIAAAFNQNVHDWTMPVIILAVFYVTVSGLICIVAAIRVARESKYRHTS